MEALLDFDRTWFALINHDWTNGVLDWFFPAITDLHKNPMTVLVVLPLLGFWIWKKGRTALHWSLMTIVAIGFSDFLAYRVIKENVQRIRPNKAGIEFQLRTNDHSGSSFPSNHAANSFAAATTLSGGLPQLAPLFYAGAFLIAYSRVYVGVHYPLDVICGAVFGIAIGAALRKGYKVYLAKFRVKKKY